MSASAPGGVRAGSDSASALPGAGMVLGGRYRLWERLGERDGSVEWRATDEVLARPVAVRTFLPGCPRTGEAIAAARAAARVSDPRLARVLDADERAEPPYIVTEWPSGARLCELLAEGPLAPWRAVRVIADAAEAIAVAHEAGLAHLCLNLDTLWCDAHDTVKITGLGVASALTGTRAADPARADARDLARLLYAALTGYWPGPGRAALPPAPCRDGKLRSPGQARPGIPARISTITCRALRGEAYGAQPPIFGPAQLAMELATITRPDRSPIAPADAAAQPTLLREPTAPAVPPNPATLPLPPLRPATPRPESASRNLLMVIVMIVVLALLAVLGWLLFRELAVPGHATAWPAGLGRA